MKAIVKSLSVVVAVCTLQAALGGTWYVAPPPLGNNKNPGTQELPLATIQRAIDAAKDGDTVIVAQGTYVENVNFKGKNILLTSTDPLDWSVVGKTIIDGNKNGSVVVFAGTENETCVLSGFTIRNGSGTLHAVPYGGTALEGGGVFGGGWGSPRARATIQNNIITANTATDGGGILTCDGLVRNNIFIGNTVTGSGGAICGCAGGVILNNVIAGNSALDAGGGAMDCGATFANNVVVGNTAGHGGGLIAVGTTLYEPPGGSITNCIVWGNTSPVGPQLLDCIAPAYCCIQDFIGGGEGNIALNPGFTDPDGPDNDPNTYEDNDYRLLANSPCIDKGQNEDWMATAVDLDGKPRILAGASSLTVDMGAYEFRFRVAGITLTSPGGSLELSWKSKAGVRYGVWSCTGLTGGLWNVEANVPAGKEVTTWTDPDMASPLKFYRVEIK